MAALLPPLLKFQPLDANGNPVPGGKVYTYAAGTSTPLATYGSDGVTPNTNPIVLDANGACDMRLNPVPYKINVVDSSDVQVSNWPVDNISTPTADFSQQTVAKGAYLIGFIQDETGAVGRTVADKLYEMPVSITEFGAVGGGADDSAAFTAAIATGRNVLVPTGTWKASFTLDNDGQMLVGEGSNNSKITPASTTVGIVVDALRVSIKELTVIAYDDFTGKLVDCDGVATSPRYLTLTDLTLRQDVSAVNDAAAVTAAALLSVQDDSYFTGYNSLLRVRTRGGQYGCKLAGMDIVSATSIRDCVFSRAGYWGLHCLNLANVSLDTLDVSNNGSLATAGTVRTETHGGIYIGGTSRIVKTNNIYCEYNVDTFDGSNCPNNVFVSSASTGVELAGSRNAFAGNGAIKAAYYAQAMGENQGLTIGTEYTKPGIGQGRVLNPRFEQRDSSNKPHGWIINGSGVYTWDAADKPLGFTGSLVLDPNSTTNNRLMFNILSASVYGGALRAAQAGQKLTLAGWFKLTDVASDIATSDVVFGIGVGDTMSSTRLNIGRKVFENEWVYVIQQYTLTGSETEIRCGVVVLNPKCKIKLAGMNYTIGAQVPDFYAPFRTASATFNPASLAAGASGAIQTLAVSGAAIGDHIHASFSLDAQGVTFPAWVSAADTISYYAHNPSNNPAGTVDLNSGTIRFQIRNAASV